MIWILVAAALLLILALLYFIGQYFFKFTFRRLDKPYDWESGLDPDGPIRMIRDRAFFDSPDRQAVEITARDGVKLSAWLHDRGTKKTLIFCHGYQGGPEELTGIAAPLYAEGYNILLIYQRAHQKSGGDFFTMGVKECRDVADWINYVNQRYPGGVIGLYGWSMGGATVMGTVGESLPENVKCAVEDCGYVDLFEELAHATTLIMPKLPCKRFLTGVLDLYCRLFKGFSIRYSLAKPLSRCKIPMLFIHGSADELVPYENLDRCYSACAGQKLRSSYAGAAHISSFGREPERYHNEISGFYKSWMGE